MVEWEYSMCVPARPTICELHPLTKNWQSRWTVCMCRCAMLQSAGPGSPEATHTHAHTHVHCTVTVGCPSPGRPKWALPIQTLWSPWSGKGPGSEEFVHANTSHFLWQNTTTCPSLKDPHSARLKCPRYSPPGNFLLSEAFTLPCYPSIMNYVDGRDITFSNCGRLFYSRQKPKS